MMDESNAKKMPVNLAQRAIDFATVPTHIFGERSQGSSATIGEIVSKHGFEDEQDFWNTLLSEPLNVDLFVHILRDCLIPPAFHQTPAHPGSWIQQIRQIETQLHNAMRKAFDTSDSASWFIKSKDGKLLVQPRQATEWLLSKPMRAALVPSGLKEFLRPSNDPLISRSAPVPSVDGERRLRGPKPDKKELVKAAMRKLERKSLAAMKEEAMASAFSASRDTCRKARKEVLSET